MLNVFARARLSAVLEPAGRALARAHVSANALTVLGLVGVLVGTLVFAARGFLLVGVIVVTISAFTDVLDGAVARASGKSSPWGAFLDSTSDRIADAAIFGSLVFWLFTDHRPVAATGAIVSLAGALTVSYVKARAEGLGYTCDVGIAERGERLIAIGVITLLDAFGVPYALEVGLWLLAVACVITVGQRMYAVWKQAR
jgi:CDP-diacylglycerol--glycerol-3-phosphate 3-phosphatidyltransferase